MFIIICYYFYLLFLFLFVFSHCSWTTDNLSPVMKKLTCHPLKEKNTFLSDPQSPLVIQNYFLPHPLSPLLVMQLTFSQTPPLIMIFFVADFSPPPFGAWRHLWTAPYSDSQRVKVNITFYRDFVNRISHALPLSAILSVAHTLQWLSMLLLLCN